MILATAVNSVFKDGAMVHHINGFKYVEEHQYGLLTPMECAALCKVRKYGHKQYHQSFCNQH